MRYFEKRRIVTDELEDFLQHVEFDTVRFPHDVQKALRYIHDHLFDPALSVSRVYERCNVRSHNLTSRFTCMVGLGIREYIEDRRMMAAMRLLWQQNLQVYLIASSLGFAYHETFTRAFKRWIGLTPSEFRLHFVRGRSVQLGPSPRFNPRRG